MLGSLYCLVKQLNDVVVGHTWVIVKKLKFHGVKFNVVQGQQVSSQAAVAKVRGHWVQVSCRMPAHSTQEGGGRQQPHQLDKEVGASPATRGTPFFPRQAGTQ